MHYFKFPKAYVGWQDVLFGCKRLGDTRLYSKDAPDDFIDVVWCSGVPHSKLWGCGVVPVQASADTTYPDGNPKSIQGAKKHALRYSPTAALIHMNAAFTDGAKKYGPANWREKGVAASVYIDAALRHLALYYDGGEQVASDSGAHHLGHAMACLAIILDAEAAGTLTDDRPIPMPNLEALLKRT